MKHQMKIDKLDTMKIDAVCHLIGEYERLTNEAVPTDKIAKFIGVTKPTAIKYLKMMEGMCIVEMRYRKHRPNSYAYDWMLQPRYKTLYENNSLKRSYEYYSAIILGIARMRGKGKVRI